MASIANQVRMVRGARGFSQAALAEQVGISRQALSAIEAARQVPSTSVSLRLAAALKCQVEDLFSLGVPSDLTVHVADSSPSERRRAVVGCVEGRWVAHSLDAMGSAAADGLLGEPAPDGTRGLQPFGEAAPLARNVLVAGCAPPLGMVAGRAAQRFDDARVHWLPSTSSAALEMLSNRVIHVAGLHLFDAGSGECNLPFIRERFPGQSMLVASLVGWQQGLVVAAGNPKGIESPADLLGRELRFAWRQRGSGSRQISTTLMQHAGATSEQMPDGPQLDGHLEVARAVALGLADAGVTIESAALAMGLGFVPLVEERFDLVVPTAWAAHRPVSRLLEAIDDPTFRREVSAVGGYDVSSTGHVSTVQGGA